MKYLFLILFLSLSAEAKLNVLTTTTTLADLVKQIGGDKVSVNSITQGGQDPHYLEAKPSYMLLARKADQVFSVGLELEKAWLPNVLRGSRRPEIISGARHISLGHKVEAIDVPEGRIDRSQGDVHASGNPHFYLDPLRVTEITPLIAQKLGELDPKNKKDYIKQAQDLNEALKQKHKDWAERIKKSGIQNVITYHKTMEYFLRRYDISTLAAIEPKPGIPPSPKHSLELIKKAKNSSAVCILNESFFEPTAAKRIADETKGSYSVVATEVGASAQAKDYTSMLEALVKAIENCQPKDKK